MYLTRSSAVFAASFFIIAGGFSVQAQDYSTVFGDVETSDIFGFTDGSGIGLEGEKELSLDTEAQIGKRDGHYYASESKLGFEFTPSQFVSIEFGPFASVHSIKDVTDLDNRNQVAFGGAFGEFKYLLLDRGSSSPLSITLSAEPKWRRIDETSGEHVTNFELELKAIADLELIKNRFYLGANLLYSPETTHDPEGIGAGWVRESTAGISGALSYRVVPEVFAGVELWYLRHYDSAWFNNFTGDAVYLGPTLFVQLSPKVFLRAAWNVQVSGREVDEPGASLNLADFSRHRAKVQIGWEF